MKHGFSFRSAHVNRTRCRSVRSLILLATAGFVLVAQIAAAAATNKVAIKITDQDCFECHDDHKLVSTNAQGKVISLFTDAAKLKASSHGDQSCIDCHSDIKDLPHDEIKLKPVNCAECHEDSVKAHKASAHGKALASGVTEAAGCADCHGRTHDILSYTDTNSVTYFENIPKLCGACHSDEEAMAKFDLPKSAAVVSYESSVHGLALHNGATNHAAMCTDCHGVHDILDSGNAASKLYWRNIPTTCGTCHKDIQKTFEKSIHGKAVAENHRDAPVCTDCHGEHTIDAVKLASSSVSALHSEETCGACHKAERIAARYGFKTDVVDTYVESFHGLAAGIGGVSAANCASCHGIHDILPSDDPASSVNRANLPKTCGKCHPGIGTRVASGELKIHQAPGQGETPQAHAVMLVTRIYIWIIIVVIGGMVLHNLLDWVSKVRMHVRAVRFNPGELRLTRIMRVQHVCLILTFVILAYTGFVHKYPDAWWSWPLRAMPDGSYVRGLLHRIAGWIFTAVFFLHLVLLFGTARGRSYLHVIWLSGHDGKDFWQGFKGYLRLRTTKLPHRRFNFAEKAEYWALVWGSFVMIVTGVMLIFTEATLKFLPKVCLDLAQVIHLYEAILATLAIIVWHFYWVIFDPNEYPMNTAWVLGNKAPHRDETKHDAP